MEMLSLGATVAEHISVMSNDAYRALVYSHEKAIEAAALDPRWTDLSVAIRSIGASFETGQRGTLQADEDDLASACGPLVGTQPPA